MVTYFYILFLETCPDVNTAQDDLEIHCGEGACQPCTPGKIKDYFFYVSTKNTLIREY